MPKLIDKEIFIFDVDNTLAESYGPIYLENAKIISSLLETGKTVIFSTDRSKELIEDKVLKLMPCGEEYFAQIYLLPAGGAAMYKWEDNIWIEVYAERIDSLQKDKIIEVYKDALKAVDSNTDDDPYIPNKDGLMLSIGALQPDATRDERAVWDPKHIKRQKIAKMIQEEVSDIDVQIGGAASINIVNNGVDKAYGLDKLFNILGLDKSKALFIGDGIYPGGNDYCVLNTGIDVFKVESPEDFTEKFNMLAL